MKIEDIKSNSQAISRNESVDDKSRAETVLEQGFEDDHIIKVREPIPLSQAPINIRASESHILTNDERHVGELMK